ncbi:hypothetical protein GIB67_017241 [Kingdonia uniflora]|uniref:Uncharacterized protein n=1 Tax=Kingdonia uniflora TaxID=39325 RepID=A0A7J7NKV3_9MAGN|nr:hypothetical protein GIB67_017241 [Kingdonia uniflora]
MVLKERIASETQRLKLKYFGDHYLEMAIPAPIPSTYQGLSREEAVEAEEDFYYKWRFHVFVLADEERWVCLRTLAEDKVGPSSSLPTLRCWWYRRGGDGSGGGGQERATYSGSRRWQYSSVRGKLNSTANSHSDTEGVKSTVERKESLLDKVMEEETELELVLEGLGLSRKKGLIVARLVNGIWLGIEEEKSELKKVNVELENELARSRADALKDVKQLKASHAVAIGLLQVETNANLDEIVEERDRLGRHLMLKGYYEEEVDAIREDTYVEEEDEEKAEAVGVMDGLNGVSRKTVLENQGDDVDLPEGGSEKVVREMSLRINDLEFGLAREIETSKALLSAQAELQIEEKDSEIKKGLKELSVATERTLRLQCQVDALAMKGKQADMAQYRIQALKQSEEQF